MRTKDSGNRVSLYRRLWWTEGANWRLAVGLGFFVLGCGVFMAAFMWALPMALEPPRRADLVAIAGVVQSTEYDGGEVSVVLEEQPRSFRYGAKAGELDAVVRAVVSGAKVEFLVSEQTGLSDEVPVYAVIVDGRSIRSLEQVQQSWRRDNDAIRNLLGPIFLAFGSLLAAVFFAAAAYEQRRHPARAEAKGI